MIKSSHKTGNSLSTLTVTFVFKSQLVRLLPHVITVFVPNVFLTTSKVKEEIKSTAQSVENKFVYFFGDLMPEVLMKKYSSKRYRNSTVRIQKKLDFSGQYRNLQT